MKIFKKIIDFCFDKGCWLAAFIEVIFWIVFIFLGGYILFFSMIQPVFFKWSLIILLGAFLFLLCGPTIKFVFKKLEKTPPGY